MTRISSLLLLLFLCASASAQPDMSAKKKDINRVKKDAASYLYVEVIDSVEGTAAMKARHYLAEEINRYAASQGGIPASEATSALEHLVLMPRGNDRFRAFAYIKKSDVLSATGKAQPSAADATAQPEPTAPSPAASRRQETIGRLLRLQRFAQLEQCLSQLRQEGRIGKYGKQKDLDDLDSYVLIIYNRDGNIEALLGEGPLRTNLSSGAHDDVGNYKGRGAIGVRIID